MFQIFPPVFPFSLFCSVHPPSVLLHEASNTSGNLRWVCRVWGSPGEGALIKQGLDPINNQYTVTDFQKKKKKKRKSFAQVLDCVMFWWVCVFRCFHWIVVYVHISERACLFHSDVSIWCTCNVKTNKKNIQNYYASKTRLEYRL